MALDVGGLRLEADHMDLPQTELGRVFHRDDALVSRNEPRQDVEQGGLPGAGAAGHDDVEP